MVPNIGQTWIVKETESRPNFDNAERSEFIFYRTKKNADENFQKTSDLTKFSMTISDNFFGQILLDFNIKKNGQNLAGLKAAEQNAFWNLRNGKNFEK